jgi:uncharacterized protein (TIGR00299 family) protein
VSVLYLDAVGGLAGDMILGALLDAGTPVEDLRSGLARLPLTSFRLEVTEEKRRGFRGLRVHVDPDHEHAHRHLADVLAILDAGSLPARARARAGAVFEALARAEAKVHGTSIERVHFHEVGAVDSIVDVAGISLALEALDVTELWADRIPLGYGKTTGAHGEFPIPAPAVLELLHGWPVTMGERPYEQTTPTGAAVVAALARPGRPSGEARVQSVGIGFGSRQDPDGLPNMTRAIVLSQPIRAGEVLVIEATLDDMNPEWMGALTERLRGEGALDVFVQSVQMKKNRLGVLVTVLAAVSDGDRLSETLLNHSTTLGLRLRRDERRELARRIERVGTRIGEARVKITTRPDGRETVSPEFEDCRALSETSGLPLAEIYAIVEEAWRRGR